MMSRFSVLMLFGTICLLSFAADKNVQMTVTLQMSDNEEVAAPILEVPASKEQPKAEEPPPPPPEPSASDASDPRKLVRYFCRMWKDEEYERMYWAMTPKYRKEVTLKKFTGLFESDAERTGGLKDENIVVDDVDEGKFYIVTVDLRFNFVRAKDRRVKAVLEKVKQGYRIKSSGIIPVDLNDL